MTTGFVYSKLSLSLGSKLIDLTADDFKLMLLGTYTVGTTQDDAQFVSDVLAHATETSGTGYTAGGKSLVSPTFTGSGLTWTLDSSDLTWGAATFTASHALLYDSTPGSNAANPVIAYFDGLGPATGGSYTVVVNTSGLLALTAI